MKQLLSGLEAISKNNICHRDIKPENLNFRKEDDSFENNQIVICDFGLATYKSSMVDKLICTKCGSSGYIAPEILNQSSNSPNF